MVKGISYVCAPLQAGWQAAGGRQRSPDLVVAEAQFEQSIRHSQVLGEGAGQLVRILHAGVGGVGVGRVVHKQDRSNPQRPRPTLTPTLSFRCWS